MLTIEFSKVSNIGAEETRYGIEAFAIAENYIVVDSLIFANKGLEITLFLQVHVWVNKDWNNRITLSVHTCCKKHGNGFHNSEAGAADTEYKYPFHSQNLRNL